MADRADRQRGAGSFEGSLGALRALNATGYGRKGTGLILDIAHNPAGAYLPGSQSSLESEYRHHLFQSHGIEFNRLFVLTNCPLGRYLDFLVRSDNLGDYMQTLLERGFDLNHSRLAWVGDGNNVCHSLIEAASILGFGITVVTPKGFEPDAGIVSQCVARSMRTGAP